MTGVLRNEGAGEGAIPLARDERRIDAKRNRGNGRFNHNKTKVFVKSRGRAAPCGQQTAHSRSEKLNP